MCVYICTHMHTCVCACMESRDLSQGTFTCCPPSCLVAVAAVLFWRWGLFTEPQVCHFSLAHSQESFSIPQLLNYRHPQQCPAFIWMLEIPLRSSCLCRRCSAHSDHAIISSNILFLFNWEKKNQILHYKENNSIHHAVLNSDHLLQGRRVPVLNTHVLGVCGQNSLCGIITASTM